MIFSRRYVFETRRTRTRRFLLNAGVVMIALVLLYGTFLVYMVVSARSERTRWAEGLYQKAPDAIVVFTGDRGRLARAVELSKRWPEAQLLISGVYGGNSLKTLVQGREDAQALLESPTPVDLDYEAMDTLGNVRETLEHVERQLHTANRLLIVTSDYHVLRVRMIFAALLQQRPLKVYFESVATPGWRWAEVRKYALESTKIVRAWFLLKFSRA